MDALNAEMLAVMLMYDTPVAKGKDLPPEAAWIVIVILVAFLVYVVWDIQRG